MLRRGPLRGGPAQLRTAVRAGDRFSMEAPVGRVRVFLCAGGTQRKAGHGGVGAIVGERLDQRIAGTALCAIDEGVAITAIPRVREFPEAVIACEVVGRDEDARRGAGRTGEDLEALRERA